MQVHRRFQQRLVFALAPDGCEDGGLPCSVGEAFLNRTHERGMRSNFQPRIHAKLRQCDDGWRKLHGLTHAI